MSFWKSFWDDFDLADDVTLLVENFALIVDLFPCAVADFAFGKTCNGFSIFVQDFALFVDFKAFQNVDPWELRRLWFLALWEFLLSTFALFCSLFNKLRMESFHRLVCGFARNDFYSANDIAIVIKDLALFIRYLASTLFWVGVFSELTNRFTLFVQNFAFLVDLLALQD